MAHPTVESIVAGDAGAHLATCDSCRQIATMLGLAVPPDAHALPGVDDSVYTEWSPLAEGRGGMGRIFRVLDRRLGRFVAIKQPAPGVGEGARAGLVRRFEREARLTARLQHPAIVGVYEAGRFKNGESFFAMPLLRGAPLSAEIDKRKTLDERLALLPHLTTVAEAVAYAHGEGIVHRDIKPANILIGTFGETVLLDWGLAKALTDDNADPVMELPATDGLTQLGVGTPQYMPPEQARGDAPEPGVDIYALGATLYHALAGEPPYGMAKGTAIRRELATSTPRSLIEIEPDVPRELADIVARAMERDPARRFTSAQALADELRRYQTGQLLTTRRYTLGELVRHFARRHRAALRIGALALVALIAIAVFAFVRIARERDHARLSETHAQRELRRAQGTIASQQAADPARRLDAIVRGLNAIGPDLRGEPVAEGLQGLVDALTAGPPLVPLAHTGLVKDIQPAGDRLVGVDDARALLVWDARSGKQLARYPTSFASPETAHVSPDHQRVAVCGFENHTDVFELATGARSSIETKSNSLCGFLPDGRLVIGAESVTLRDPHTMAVIDTLPLLAPTTGMAIGPDFVAVSSLDDFLSVWHPGKRSDSVRIPASVVMQLDPEAHTLYLNGNDQRVRALDLTTLAATEVWQLKDAHLARDTLSPDGRYLAIGMFDMDGLRRATVLDRTGGPTRELDGMTQEFAANTWVFAERHVGQLEITDVETGGTVLALDAHHDEVGVTFVAPHLLSRDRVGPAFVWDLTSSFASGMLLGHSGEIVVVARRGTRLLTASHDGTLRIWSDRRDPIVSARRAELTAAAWLDDARIVVGDAAGSLTVLDATTGKEITATKTNGPITSLAIDGDRIAFGGLDGTLALSDVTLTNIVRVKSPGPVTAIALAHGTLASGHDDGSTHLWNAQTGAELASAADKEPLEEADDHDGHTGLVFSADGATLYASRPSSHTLVFATKDLAQRATLDGRLVSALDGTHIAAAAVDGTVLVHDLVAGTTQKLAGHQASVLAAAFSDDHQRLATASIDGTVRIWNLQTGATTLVITAPGLGPATAVTFIGDLVAVGYASGALRLHPTNAASARTRACWVLARFDRTRDVAPFCN